MDLPENILSTLHCSQCNAYLSIFPIHTYQDGTFVCGRCPLINNQTPVRDMAYETLAQQLTFPCLYKASGCLDKLTPGELKGHEASCNYKIFYCPYLPQTCQWSGQANELLEHYGEEHVQYLLKENESFGVDLKEDCEINRILESCNEVFLVQTKKIDTTIYGSVRLIGPQKNARFYNYNLSFYSENTSDGLDFPKYKVECDESNAKIKVTTAFTLDIATLKEFNSPTVQCQVFITKEKKFLEKTENLLTELHQTLLKHLECPVCFEYMVPPIYHCVNSHIICGTCKANVHYCPSCNVQLGDMRNRALESITDDLLYNCKYQGCTIVSYSKDKLQHEQNCTFAPYHCVFDDCVFSGTFQDLLDHVLHNHFEQVLQYNKVITFFNTNGAIDTFVFKRQGCMFKLNHKVEDDHFYLSVQFVGPRETDSKFNCIFDVCNENDPKSNERIVIKFKCLPLKGNDETFDDETYYIQLPNTLLAPFIDEIHMTYKIDIVEEN